ncbi:unnamed protein product [Amoebophrya sp. A120]|nr:unnamed protein product [Amoebophrya sp. A120]|eukprot:GSA120T00018978001.1
MSATPGSVASATAYYMQAAVAAPSSSTAPPAAEQETEAPVVVVSDDVVKDFMMEDFGLPEEWSEYTFTGLCLVVGLLFAFRGLKMMRLVFFLVGFLTGFWVFQLFLQKNLPKTVPSSTATLLQYGTGLLSGIATVSVVPLAMFCLGALCWLPFAGLAFQQILMFEIVIEQLEHLPEGDAYLNLVRYAFLGISTFVAGYLASRKVVENMIFICATSFLGAYLICLGFNHIWRATEGEGEFFTPLFEMDALIKERGDEMLQTESGEFWLMVNGLVVSLWKEHAGLLQRVLLQFEQSNKKVLVVHAVVSGRRRNSGMSKQTQDTLSSS